MTINNEFVTYLKSNIGFRRFMKEWKNQYIRLGRLGGTIKLSLPSDEEKEALSGLMGRDYHDSKTIVIRYTDLEKEILKTKFSDIVFIEVLNSYFAEDIQTKKELLRNKQQIEEDFFNQLMYEYKHTKSGDWLNHIQTSETGTYARILQYAHTPDSKDVVFVLDALNHLPSNHSGFQRLDVFANQITSDSHYFDESGSCFPLLLQGIAYMFQVELPKTLEDRFELLYKSGLMKDTISNFTYSCRLLADDVSNTWSDFYDNYEILVLTLNNIIDTQSISDKIRAVLIFENPSVFEMISEYAKDNRIDDIGFLCTNGQLNLSSYYLIDKIVERNIDVYYAGDFDPEGLIICEKLKIRYPNITFLKYDKESYYKALSHIDIEKNRLQMLNTLQSYDLFEIRDCILKEHKAAYQEALIDVYYQELTKIYQSR